MRVNTDCGVDDVLDELREENAELSTPHSQWTTKFIRGPRDRSPWRELSREMLHVAAKEAARMYVTSKTGRSWKMTEVLPSTDPSVNRSRGK